jgi:hypothetical protein
MDVDNAMREFAVVLKTCGNDWDVDEALRESGLADLLRAGQAMYQVLSPAEMETSADLVLSLADTAERKFEAWLKSRTGGSDGTGTFEVSRKGL